MESPEYERMYRLESWHWWFVSRRRIAIALIEEWTGVDSQRRILDVGCGTGGNLETLQRWGYPIGIDLSPLPLKLARGRGLTPLVQASALSLPYPSGVFELVTAFDVLYHQWVRDDDQAIREIYRVLCPSGWLLITDSALPGLWSKHDVTFQARQRYSLDDIRGKLTRAGFKPHQCSYTFTTLLPITIAIRLMMRWLPLSSELDLKPPPGWLNRGLIGIGSLERWWLRRKHTLPVGSSLICLAQKPPHQR
jgi:SAM-dependent methyltransferase